MMGHDVNAQQETVMTCRAMLLRPATALIAATLLGAVPAAAQLSSSLSEQPRRAAPNRPVPGEDDEAAISALPKPGRTPEPDTSRPRPLPSPPARALPTTPAPASPPLPAVMPAAGPDQRPMATASLVAQAEAATVFIVADDGTGSGFFVTPDTIATNAHVVNGARNGTVLVASKRLGRVLRGRIIFQSSLNGREWPDIAFVRLDQAVAPAVVVLSPEVGKLDQVVAAGYPGLLSTSDRGVRRLISGEAEAAPELVFERGAVATLNHEAANLIVHSAFLAQGNSGGPLFDVCGRAIGINSAILRDGRVGGQYNIAQDVQELVRQAKRLNVPVSFVGGKCIG
jgi:S1-C subfamily serine protease